MHSHLHGQAEASWRRQVYTDLKSYQTGLHRGTPWPTSSCNRNCICLGATIICRRIRVPDKLTTSLHQEGGLSSDSLGKQWNSG